jgi:hypothetical protein
MTDERICLEAPILPVIATVSLPVECYSIDRTICIDIFPFTGEDMAVTGLRARRWRREIHGNSLMSHRLGASSGEQRGNNKERECDVS